MLPLRPDLTHHISVTVWISKENYSFLVCRRIKKRIMTNVIGNSIYIMWVRWSELHVSVFRNIKQAFVVALQTVCRHCSGMGWLGNRDSEKFVNMSQTEPQLCNIDGWVYLYPAAFMLSGIDFAHKWFMYSCILGTVIKRVISHFVYAVKYFIRVCFNFLLCLVVAVSFVA